MRETANPIDSVCENDKIMKIIVKHAFNQIICDNNYKGCGFIEIIQEMSVFRAVNRSMHHLAHRELQSRFQRFEIININPHDGKEWREENILNKTIDKDVVLLNKFRIEFRHIIKAARHLVKLGIRLGFADIFPVERDLYGVPPQSCTSMLSTLVHTREELKSIVAVSSKKSYYPLNCIVNALGDLKLTTNHIEQITLSSTFFEYTANNLDYSEAKADPNHFFGELKKMFGNLRCTTLNMVLTDCIIPYDDRVSGQSISIPCWYPQQLMRATILALKPNVLNIKLRTEAAQNLEDAYRFDWEDEEIFSVLCVHNSNMFSTIENKSLGTENGLTRPLLIVDTYSAASFEYDRLADVIDYLGRDWLTIFPNKTIIFKLATFILPDCRMKEQILEPINFAVSAFWKYPELAKGRVLCFKIAFIHIGQGRLSRREMRKSMLKTVFGRKIRRQYNFTDAKLLFSNNRTPFNRYKNRWIEEDIERIHVVSLFDETYGNAIHFELCEHVAKEME